MSFFLVYSRTWYDKKGLSVLVVLDVKVLDKKS